MPDFSFLSQGVQGPQIVNPLQLATQGMTLADLSSKINLSQLQQQSAQIGIQAQQQQAQAIPEFMQRLAAGQSADQIFGDPSFTQKYAYAVPKLQSDWRALQQVQADIDLKKAQAGEAGGKAQQATAAALKDNLTSVGNLAGTLLDQASSGKVDPWKALGAVNFAAQKAGIDPKMFGLDTSVPGGDPSAALAQLQSVAGNALSAADRIKLPSEVALNTARAGEATASANLSNVNASVKPFEAQSGRISANASASQAATASARQQYGEATSGINPITGDAYRVLPGNAQNPAGSAQAVPGGQIGPTAVDNKLIEASKAQMDKAVEDRTVYTKVQQALPLLKQTLSSGYNGPLLGSDTGKQVLSLLSPLMTQDQLNKLANTKAADAIQGELIGNLIKEISTRGSNMATKVVLARKPGTENPLAASLAMIDALDQDSKNGIAQADAFLNYAKNNPRDIGFTGYQAPTPGAIPTNTAQPKVGVITPSGGHFVVVAPDGKPYTFQSESQAMEFKQKAGI